MKKLLLSIITIVTLGANAQNVNIPDANFKAYLLGNTAINTNSDTEIQVSEANAFTGGIDCSNLGISDLTGIEAFIALTELRCNYNNLTALDVTQNITLTVLHCQNNYGLTTLDITQNIALTELMCEYNNMTALNVSQNTALIKLWCGYNYLTVLDVSQNTALEIFRCRYNSLTVLDLLQNTSIKQVFCDNNSIGVLDLSQATALSFISCYTNNLTALDVSNGNNSSIGSQQFKAYLNPNLTCIQVDDVAYSTTNWTNIDAGVSFSTNCGSLGINEHVNNINLSIYPNPTSDNLTIDTEDNIESIIIVDIMGKQVKTFIPTANTIDVSSLVKGIYFLQVKTENEIFNNRFIKR